MVSQPYNNKLTDRVVEKPEQIDDYPSILLTEDEYMDLELIATGAYSPLEGFMDKQNFKSVLDNLCLKDGTPWSIPIVLSSKQQADKVQHKLIYDGEIVGSIDVVQSWRYKPKKWMHSVLNTTEEKHPGVRRIKSLDDWLVGGKINLYKKTPVEKYEIRLTPKQTRSEFKNRSWDTIVGFQTRNPPHRAHEYLQKCALETVDGLFINPLVGKTKPSDVDAEIRMEAYETLIEKYHVSDRIFLSTLKAPMRYAGPREALFHAIIRQNYGCTHFIIGRDHAGVKDYYGSYEAHKLLKEFEDKIDIQPIYFDYAFYCHRCDGMATEKTCSHSDHQRERPSGTKIREAIRSGSHVSPKIMRPEISKKIHNGINKSTKIKSENPITGR